MLKKLINYIKNFKNKNQWEHKDYLNSLGIEQLRIDFDTRYGINNKSGWSVYINGYCLSELEPSLQNAIDKAILEWEKIKNLH